MKFITYTFILLVFASVIVGCSKKEGCTNSSATNYDPDADEDDGSCIFDAPSSGTFKLIFDPYTTGNQPLVFNQPYSDSANYTLQVEGFKFYISNITLVNTNNQEVKIKDVDLIDFKTAGENYSSINVPLGDYKEIKFGIGVDSVLNNTDPTVYANSHPLSVFQNTYWNWSTQYRFIMLEGRADTISGSNSNLNQLLIYHTGTENLYREYSKSVNFSVQLNATHEESLKINLNKIFYGVSGNVDLKSESATHTTTNFALALKITENFLSAIE